MSRTISEQAFQDNRGREPLSPQMSSTVGCSGRAYNSHPQSDNSKSFHTTEGASRLARDVVYLQTVSDDSTADIQTPPKKRAAWPEDVDDRRLSRTSLPQQQSQCDDNTTFQHVIQTSCTARDVIDCVPSWTRPPQKFQHD